MINRFWIRYSKWDTTVTDKMVPRLTAEMYGNRGNCRGTRVLHLFICRHPSRHHLG